MPLGSRSLAQTAEALRKLRNTVRFILGNMGDAQKRVVKGWKRVERTEMGLADRYVMHELKKLESVAVEGYESFNFPRGTHFIDNFCSSLRC
jgi:isoleucyl-tRNA synthetase